MLRVGELRVADHVDRQLMQVTREDLAQRIVDSVRFVLRAIPARRRHRRVVLCLLYCI